MEGGVDLEELKKLTPEQKRQVISSLQQQSQLQNAQTLMADMTDRCQVACIKSPGESLSSVEQRCLARCMDRFMDSWNRVSKVLQERIVHASASLPSSYGSSSEGPTFS